MPAISTRALTGPSDVCSVQRPASSSHVGLARPWCRSGSSGRGRARARSAAGSRGSPAAASRSGSSRVRRERERVQVRGHVAGAAGIRVGPPRAADVVVALEHEEVLDSLPAQADRHAEAGEAGAEDRDVDGCGAVVHARYVTVTYTSVTSSARCHATTTRLPASERREQLLDTTKAIVAARGFHAVSIEAVARAAGVSRPIVYGHFEHLGGLLEALVLRESTRALVAARRRVLPSGLEEPRAQLLVRAARRTSRPSSPIRTRGGSC